MTASDGAEYQSIPFTLSVLRQSGVSRASGKASGRSDNSQRLFLGGGIRPDLAAESGGRGTWGTKTEHGSTLKIEAFYYVVRLLLIFFCADY